MNNKNLRTHHGRAPFAQPGLDIYDRPGLPPHLYQPAAWNAHR